jgi:hypothetical protein
VFTCDFNGLIQGSGGASHVLMMVHASLSRRTPFVLRKGDISTAKRWPFCAIAGAAIALEEFGDGDAER